MPSQALVRLVNMSIYGRYLVCIINSTLIVKGNASNRVLVVCCERKGIDNSHTDRQGILLSHHVDTSMVVSHDDNSPLLSTTPQHCFISGCRLPGSVLIEYISRSSDRTLLALDFHTDMFVKTSVDCLLVLSFCSFEPRQHPIIFA